MRALVTGAGGFVGRHLVSHLVERGDEVVGVDVECDVTNRDALSGVLERVRPTVIYHLAALSSVAESFDDPESYERVNVGGTRSLLDVARMHVPAATVLVVSSADVYGVHREDGALSETHATGPVSPYARSKLAAEEIARRAAREGQGVLIARPFPHLGPGQGERFVVPSLVLRLLGARARGESRILTGDLSVRRDYTDVRDVVRAYRLLVEHGRRGETYNVASGRDVALSDVARLLVEMMDVEVDFAVDPALLRPAEVRVLRGDVAKVHEATGWEPRLSLRQSLADVIRDVVDRSPAATRAERSVDDRGAQ